MSELGDESKFGMEDILTCFVEARENWKIGNKKI